MNTKENILLVAKNLFYKFGIRAVTMDDIAKELGMSKKTLYLHFKDKESILDLVIVNVLEEDRVIWLKIDQENENVMTKIFKGHQQLKQVFEGMNPSLMFEIKKYHSKVWQKFEAHKKDFIFNDVKKILALGIEQGYFRPEIDIDFFAAYRMEQVELGFNNTTFGSLNKNIATIQTALEDHFIRGILSLKGLEMYNQFNID